MNSDNAKALRELIARQQIAALATLHNGAPYVSMAPFAVAADGLGFIIHVSQLAAHTRDMLADSRVSLLVVAPQTSDVPAQALARVTIQGNAARFDRSGPGYRDAKRAYLSRFPQSANTFEFADFSLFSIVPTSVRFVAGFAQAGTITPDALADVLRSI